MWDRRFRRYAPCTPRKVNATLGEEGQARGERRHASGPRFALNHPEPQDWLGPPLPKVGCLQPMRKRIYWPWWHCCAKSSSTVFLRGAGDVEHTALVGVNLVLGKVTGRLPMENSILRAKAEDVLVEWAAHGKALIGEPFRTVRVPLNAAEAASGVDVDINPAICFSYRWKTTRRRGPGGGSSLLPQRCTGAHASMKHFNVSAACDLGSQAATGGLRRWGNPRLSLN